MNHNITITPDVAAHVLWHYGLGGYPPGSFTRALLDLWGAADKTNRAKMSAAWPNYALALQLGLPGTGPGVDLLRALTGIDPVNAEQMADIMKRVDFNSVQGEGN